MLVPFVNTNSHKYTPKRMLGEHKPLSLTLTLTHSSIYEQNYDKLHTWWYFQEFSGIVSSFDILAEFSAFSMSDSVTLHHKHTHTNWTPCPNILKLNTCDNNFSFVCCRRFLVYISVSYHKHTLCEEKMSKIWHYLSFSFFITESSLSPALLKI